MVNDNPSDAIPSTACGCGQLQIDLHQCHRIFESVSNGITIADATKPGMPLFYVNPTFERITGYTAAEVCGRSCKLLQGTQTNQPGIESIRQALRLGQKARVVLRNFRKDGTPFWNQLYLAPIRNETGLLTHFVGIQNDVTMQVDANQRLQHLAYHDALTGLANRSLLMDRLRHALKRALRKGDSVALLYFDLDGFKQVNDTFGHDAGDSLLALIAERMRSVVRSSETIARIGGDEFVVLLQDLSPSRQAFHVMSRLLSSVGERTDVFGVNYHPSASVGMAIYPDDGDSPEGLLKAADRRMYVAKHGSGPTRCKHDGLAPHPANGVEAGTTRPNR